jgi:hypothetical protein
VHTNALLVMRRLETILTADDEHGNVPPPRVATQKKA